MKIETVILQNIGVYVNRNEFDLRADKPIILIGGLNGRGKTTFLEAVLFALYGRRFQEGGQSLQGLENYLRKISNISGESSECFVEMQFTVQEQETVTYRIKRCWNLEKKSLKMVTQVSKNGVEDEVLSGNWDMFVEEILPRAIASFFFFDGEKIAELAASGNDAHIRSSIISLLGIDIINQLITDLNTILISRQKQIEQNQYGEELASLNAQAEELAERLREKEQELQTEKEKLQVLEEEWLELEGQFSTAGGRYAEYRKQFEDEKREVLQELDANKLQMMDIAASSLPLKMVASLLEEVLHDSEGENEQRELQIFVKQFPVLYKEYSGGKKPGRELGKFLAAVENKVMESQNVYELDDDAREHLRRIGQVLDEENMAASRLIQEQKRLNERLGEIENYLAVKVDDEKIAELYGMILDKAARKAETAKAAEQLEYECQELNGQLENVAKTRKQLLQKVVNELEAADDNLRVISYAQKQIDILQTYKVRLQGLKTDALAKTMTECLKRLIAKDGLIEKVTLDPMTLEFHYFNRDGRELDKQILSSGEKQLLVIAMLWALGICAKAQFPLIIDTPLARLDSVHRVSLIENYFPNASEQVIILSTDQEITDRDYETLKKYLGKEYTLIYDEATMSSSICPGYFWRSRT